ncbi:MAG: hypothetical protein J6V28_00430 [Tidjanibacter sp.]|nr:hypothetical protein [Tidjanibacter sp.]
MKKLFVSMFAIAAAVFATSCTNEVLPEAQLGDEATVSYTVNAPEVATRVFGDGTQATNLYYAVYLWDKNGNYTLLDAISVTHDGTNNTPEVININTTVEFKLVNGNTYSFLFWAENDATVADINWNAMTMQFNPAKANVEGYDAFYAYVEPFKVEGRIDDQIDLFRPFAQVNVGTADYQAAVDAGTTITNAGIEIEAFTTLNFASGEVSGATTAVYAPEAIPTEAFPVAGYKYLTMNYVLVGADKHLVDVKFNYNDGANEYNREYTNVPVRRNYRTNIFGNILTEDANYTIEIKPDFFEDPAAHDVFHAFQHGGEATLTQDIEIEHPLVVKAGVKAVLNLNNFSIKNNVNNTDTDVIIVEEGAELTINGEGTIEAVSGNDGYAVIAKGTVIINGGTFAAGVDANGEANAVVYARDNGKVIVNGGTFPNENNSAFVLNKRDADRATAVIEARGGRYYKFNPANNAAENAGTNFCPEGYNVIVDGDWYEVVTMAIVKTVEEFKAAAANKNIAYISIAADLNFGTAGALVSSNKIILGNGHKFTAGGNTTKNYGLQINGAYNVTVNDIVMNNCGGIYVTNGAKVVVNNVTMGTKYSSSGRNMFYVYDAELTVNSGDYRVNNTRIKYFAAESAKITVNGGKYHGTQRENEVTVYEGGTGSVTIYGGQYYVASTRKFDPTPYLAAGYKTVSIATNWVEVVAE